jgi:hypothetical protein
MSEILEIVSGIFVARILLAGALLIGMVAIAGIVLLWKELSTAFKRTRKKELPNFYSQIVNSRIGLYQSYIDRAFELSPTLEFEEDDPRLSELLEEAVNNDSLSDLCLRVMMIQYAHADEDLRQKYQRHWVEKVMSRKESDFFPDPWSIVLAPIKAKPRKSHSLQSGQVQ